MDRLGFDNQKYLELQSVHIRKRIRQSGNRLYLEFGSKLFDDYHASRTLLGFEPNSKIRMLKELWDSVEVVTAICVSDIEENKVRGDLGITHDVDALRLIDAFRGEGLLVGSVVITQYAGQSAADALRRRMEHLGVQTCLHYPTAGYPHNTDLIASDEGYGRNDYIETSRPLVAVTTPDPGSDKMAVCPSQFHHDYERGIKAGHAKSKTFPIWNLPLQHPMNLVYEAATVDLGDVNMIDPLHLATYGETTVNHNRDMEIFLVLSATFERITGECPCKPPTDMGVNMADKCIVNDEAVRVAARQKIVCRYYTALCDCRVGAVDDELVNELELLMQQAYVDPSTRPVVAVAARMAEETGSPAGTIELPSGKVVTGKTTDLTGASFATLPNALKRLAGIGHQHHLISREVTEPVQAVKVNHLGSVSPRLHPDETLIVLAISTTTNPLVKRVLDQLSALRGYEAHSTAILSPVDSGTYSRLGLRPTYELQHETNKLYHE